MSPRLLLPLLMIMLAPVPVQAARAQESPPRQQEAARQAVRQGRYVPLEQVVADALRRYPGTLVEVELDDDDDQYEIEILGRNGVVMELDYDARTGRLLKMEEE